MLCLASLLLWHLVSDEVDPVALQELLKATTPVAQATSYQVHVQVKHDAPLGDSEVLKLDVSYQADRPCRLTSEELEAYRSQDRIVHRAAHTDEPWVVTSLQRGLPAEERMPSLPVMAGLQLPHDLLADLESRLVSLRRVQTDGGEASAIYEGELRGGVPSLLTVTVSAGGALEAFALRPRDERSRTAQELSSRIYVVSGLNTTTVEVPEEVQRLLEEGEK